MDTITERFFNAEAAEDQAVDRAMAAFNRVGQDPARYKAECAEEDAALDRATAERQEAENAYRVKYGIL